MLDCRGEFAITALDGVALFGDRKRAELERRSGKNLAQPGELIGLAPVGVQRLRDARDNFFLCLAVGIERDEQGEVIERSVYLDELVAVGAVHGDYARGSKPLVEQIILQIRDIAAEDVPSAEVYPRRRGLGVFDNGGDVESRQFDACGVPRCAVLERCEIKLHVVIPPHKNVNRAGSLINCLPVLVLYQKPMEQPPSTTSVVPLTKPAALEQRYTAAQPMSSGLP